MARINRQWRLARRPQGDVKQGDLTLVESPVPQPGMGEILVRTVYLSLDPTNRIWMSGIDQYMPPVEIGEVMRGPAIGVVETSNNPAFKPGDIVQPWPSGWQDYHVLNAATPIPKGMAPLPAFMSVLGATGMTAYFGLLDVGRPLAGETVVVSAAAGAVGSIVGQIAKIKGCRVVGIAGSDEKCRHVVEDLGFDVCLNYKRGDILGQLKRACPNGIDIDFENAGGEILDACLTLINNKARIVLCGMISQYNDFDEGKAPPGPRMFRNLLMRRARCEGFIVTDYMSRMSEFLTDMVPWVAQKRIQWRTDIVEGLENAPDALQRLFTGANTGKLLIRVSAEPV